MAAASPRTLCFAAIRDEGPFLVEWIAWQRMLGFGRILIAHNDCTDRSPALLAALERAGWCETVAHAPREGQPPKTSAYRAIRGHPALAWADWMFVCDVDEFLLPHRGGGTLAGFLAAVPAEVLGVCVHWLCFGNGGARVWEDGLTHRRFVTRGVAGRSTNVFFKTLFREPARWRQLSDHAPAGFDAASGSPGPGAEARPGAMVDGALRPVARFAGEPGPIRFTEAEDISHEGAQVNHYAIREDEVFDLRRGTPSASALKDRYTDHYYRMRNQNGVTDRSALAFAARFDPVWRAAMALPGVRRLHHLCCQDHVERLCRHQGRDPAADPRWHHHRAEAERAAP
jgi:hypothetical protein